MKVFQINTVCGGSTGRIAVAIAHLLKRKGHDVCLAYGRGEAPKDIETFKIDTTGEILFHIMLSRITDKQGLYSSFATHRLINKIKKYNPDIIQLHNIHGYYLNYRMLFDFFFEYDKPVVWTLHDCWAFTGHCAYFDYVKCEKWKDMCWNCIQKKTYPASYIKDNSTMNYQLKKETFTKLKKLYLVTPSNWLTGLVNQSFLAKYKTYVIHNGVNLDIFKSTKSNFRIENHLENFKIILGVANPWTQRKGLHDFIQLSNLIDDTYKIIVVGVNRAQLKKLSSISNVIAMKKTTDVRELAALYSTADVFFNPTYEDNYPTTNIEAISCGTPVVTYKTGGSPESVKDGNGIIVDKGNIEKAWLGIQSIAEKQKKIKIKNEGQFNENYSFRKYIELYTKILNNKM